MTDISKLRELLERVESATKETLPDKKLTFDLIACFVPAIVDYPHHADTFFGDDPLISIDAAVALCERVLPGWEIRIGELPDKVGWFARVLRRKDMFLVSSRDCGPKHAGIALCAVVLRAKIAILEKDHA